MSHKILYSYPVRYEYFILFSELLVRVKYERYFSQNLNKYLNQNISEVDNFTSG
jgi:hypothetical protein